MKQTNIETIDGVLGEWRTVTKASEVSVGQRVRYEIGGCTFGYREPFKAEMCKTCRSISIFGGGQRKNIQAFFPLPVRKAKKRPSKYERLLKALLMQCSIDDNKILRICGLRFHLSEEVNKQLIAIKQAMEKKARK
jgi:hypothetical protein